MSQRTYGYSVDVQDHKSIVHQYCIRVAKLPVLQQLEMHER